MTHSYKKLSALASAALIASFVIPQISFATTTPPGDRREGGPGSDRQMQKPEGNGGNFCARINEFGSKVENRFGMMKKGPGMNQGKPGEMRNALDTQRKEHMQKVADIRKENFGRLEKIATSTDKRVAVDKFQGAINTAVDVRKAAFDAALSAYRKGMDDAQAKRQAAIEKLITDQKARIEAAVSKAKADCAAGIDPQTVRSTFEASLKAAKEAFMTERMKIEKLPMDLKPLIDTRKAAIDKAQADFKAALLKAKEDLKLRTGKEPKPNTGTGTTTGTTTP
jgi:hypothetical protein